MLTFAYIVIWRASSLVAFLIIWRASSLVAFLVIWRASSFVAFLIIWRASSCVAFLIIWRASSCVACIVIWRASSCVACIVIWLAWPSYLQQDTASAAPSARPLRPPPPPPLPLSSICNVSITGPIQNEDVVTVKRGPYRRPWRSRCPSRSVLLMTSCMARSDPNSDRQIRSDTLPAAMISEQARRHLFPVLWAQGTSVRRRSSGTPELRVLGLARDPIRHGVYFSFKDKAVSMVRVFFSLFSD